MKFILELRQPSVGFFAKVAPRHWLLIASVPLVLCALIVVFSRRNETVGLHKSIRIDDFSFTVDRVRELPDRLLADITIRNEAARVSFDFDPSLIALCDERGAFSVGMAERGSAANLHLTAGASGSATVKFPPPNKGVHAYLRWSFGGGLGRLADDVLYGSKRVRIR
ncbi:MAG TPA: hypothetical protein VFG65_07585 [Fimbriimonadales bacterium]|nr:hypothetical protein [Fimbriimonadales bacterium]